MIIHFFTKGDKNVASSRYRAYLIAENLQKRGFDTYVTVPNIRGLKGFIHYLKLLIKFKKEEKIFLQRTVYNNFFVLAAIVSRLFFNKRFVFDIDDAVYLHSPISTILLTRLANTVTCGSHEILNWANKHNKNTLFFLNGLPLDVYSVADKKYDDNHVPVIGWIGNGPSHYENLEVLVPVFEKMLENKISFSVHIIGTLGDKKLEDLFRNIEGLSVKFTDNLDWENPSEAVSEIKKFDVGVMPLTSSSWNCAKYFKAIEYMACGIPAVVSDIGELKYIIEDNKSGFLSDTSEDWVDALTNLINDKEIYTRISLEGRRVIEDKYTIDSSSGVIESLYKNNKTL